MSDYSTRIIHDQVINARLDIPDIPFPEIPGKFILSGLFLRDLLPANQFDPVFKADRRPEFFCRANFY